MSNETKHYETIIIFHPSLGEVQVKEEIKKLEALITQNQGTDIAVNNWGKREIAYFTKKQKNGTFVEFTYASVSSTIITALNTMLRINDGVLKFQTHRTQKAVRKFRGHPKRFNAASNDSSDFGDSMDSGF